MSNPMSFCIDFLSFLTKIDAMNLPYDDKEYAKMMYKKGLPFYANRIKELGFTGMDNVLDLGCGPGQWTIALAKHNKEVHGLDISENLLEIARELSPPRIQYDKGHAEKMFYPSNYFDGLFCHAVLQYTNPSLTISEIARVLKPKGKVYIAASTFWYFANIFMDGIHHTELRDSLYSILTTLHTTKKRLGFPSTTTTFFTKHELYSLFEKNGLEVTFFNDDLSWMGSFDKFIKKTASPHKYRPEPLVWTEYRKFSKMWHGKPHLYEITGVKQ